MENFSVQVAKLVGTPDQKNWSQIHAFFPEDLSKKQKRGILLAVLSFSGSPGEPEALSIGREILSRLHEEYYGETETPALERLNESLEKVYREFTSEDQELEILAAVLIDHALYLTVYGAGQIWLKRQGTMGKLLEGSGEAVSASGLVEEGDLLVLGTSSFFRLLGQGVLRAALESNEPVEAVETLAPLVHGQPQNSLIAALIGKIHREKEIVIEESPVIPKVKNLFSKMWIRFLRFRPARPAVRRQRTILTIAVVLVILLSLSIFLGARKRQQEEVQRQFTKIYGEVQSLVEQGETLTGINPAQSRQLLSEAQTKIAQLEGFKIEVGKTTELKKRIETDLSLVVKEYRLSELPVLTDLTLIGKEGRGDLFSLDGTNLAILDKTQNRIFGFDITRRSGEVLAGGDSIKQVKLLTTGGNFAFLLEEQGIAQVSLKNKEVQKGKIESDPQWGEIIALKFYAGNLYLLDKGKNMIWRYQGTERGLGEPQSWLASGVSPNFASAISMAIDGSIWLLTNEGKILKFVQGKPMAFGIAGLPVGKAGLDKPFANPSVIYTDSEINNLYVLDKGNGRVVVLAKSGEYQGQYLWPGIAEASDMVVSGAEKKILLLSGSKIYEIGLK